jgi:hypothetical protein
MFAERPLVPMTVRRHRQPTAGHGGRWCSALASKRPQGTLCRLSGGQLELLKAEQGAAWPRTGGMRISGGRSPDRRTDSPVVRCDYTLGGVSYLMYRIGWTPQMLVHRATERDESGDLAAYKARPPSGRRRAIDRKSRDWRATDPSEPPSGRPTSTGSPDRLRSGAR